ncbi:formate dehydrogenase [Clostridiales bacterium PH28_bin88]|nr:formate dehydrogenase [Clostridiales bacterium PH28_bin88]
MATVYRSVCPFDCPDTCGLLIHIEDGRVVKCTGDPEHPVTRGVICAKMSRYGDLVHSPDRILTPLKRTGPKGSGLFSPISWEQAIKEIAGRWGEILATDGGEAILPYSYAGVMGLIQRNAGHAFFHRLGASRLKRTICSPAADAGWQVTLGNTMGTDPETVVHSDLVILWGINAASTNLHFMLRVNEARRKGARVVLVEAYRSRTASMVDEVVLVKPGSDTALALGIMHVLDQEGLVDVEFVGRYVLGYQELKTRVLPGYTPEKVEALSGVPASVVVGLARAYGRAKAPFLRIGAGLSRTRQGAMTVRTITCLPALVGAFGKLGGGALQSSGTGRAFDMGLVTGPDLMRQPTREINMNQLGRAITSPMQPPIKSLYVYHSNPAAVVPDQRRVIAGLMREDLFTVVHERFLTDTARYADIILPATTSLEQHDLYRSYGHSYIQMAMPVLPAPGEAKSNWQVFGLLARAMGFEEELFTQEEETLIRRLLDQPSPLREGISYELLAMGKAVRLKTGHVNPLQFETRSGKIEILSLKAEDEGQPSLPGYNKPEDGLVVERYPFHLLPAPAHFALNSSFSQVPELRQKEGGPHVLVHPLDCQSKGVEDGEWAEVFNHRGSCLLRVVASEDTPPGVVVAPGVWWNHLSPGGGNVNCLVGDDLTDMGEGSTFYDHRVDIRPIAG